MVTSQLSGWHILIGLSRYVDRQLKRFLIECLNTKAKVLTPANHKGHNTENQ